MVFYSAQRACTHYGPNQYPDTPIYCLLLPATLMNNYLRRGKAGINFIMFPVNHLRWRYSIVILGKAFISTEQYSHWNNTTCSFSCTFDLSSLKCCNNCPINTPYVNYIMPRKWEAKTRNRCNFPMLFAPRAQSFTGSIQTMTLDDNRMGSTIFHPEPPKESWYMICGGFGGLQSQTATNLQCVWLTRKRSVILLRVCNAPKSGKLWVRLTS